MYLNCIFLVQNSGKGWVLHLVDMKECSLICSRERKQELWLHVVWLKLAASWKYPPVNCSVDYRPKQWNPVKWTCCSLTAEHQKGILCKSCWSCYQSCSSCLGKLSTFSVVAQVCLAHELVFIFACCCAWKRIWCIYDFWFMINNVLKFWYWGYFVYVNRSSVLICNWFRNSVLFSLWVYVMQVWSVI